MPLQTGAAGAAPTGIAPVVFLPFLVPLFTFAIGGSLTGFVGKKIMNHLQIRQDWLWAIIYIILITLIWPMAVILVSIPMGQFGFFRKYIRKLGQKLGL